MPIKSKIIIAAIILTVAPAGVFAHQTAPGYGSFITCDGVENPCDFADLIHLVQHALDWLVMISFSVAIITFSWAGFVLLTSGGNVGKKDKAKKMLWSIVKGFAIILAAWLIVRTIVSVLLQDGIGNQFINF